ncbi:MAG TPA: hypothetical protein VFP80_18730 [Thermoanaerobaculia bacterium]|nr:hypothetical protein [Thermoanaerobaculia bacterium]
MALGSRAPLLPLASRDEWNDAVKASRQRLLTLLAVAVVLAAPAGSFAAEAPVFTRFLVPIHVVATPGAHGSLWQSETWIRYAGLEATEMVPRPFCFAGLCPLGGLLEPGWPAVPFRHFSRELDPFTEPAFLVHIEAQHAADVTFSSRVRDLSRMSESAGTEVPVVREDDFRASPLYLLNIPVDPKFRSLLRLYALPDLEEIEVDVRYFRGIEEGEEFAIQLVHQDRTRLRIPAPIAGFRLHPALAEVDLQAIPELAALNAFWIEVVPATPGARIWAFVSVTNNETQQFTMVSPQR